MLSDGGAEKGALNLDISPADAQVYVDGVYVGLVSSFDAWPNYLWLPKGTYDILFYKEGFKTLARQLTIYPGQVIALADRLEPGPSVRPDIG